MPTGKGNSKYITVEDLWKHWCSYKQYCKENPIVTIDYKGKDATRVEIPIERPRTIEGFGEWCRDKNLHQDVSKYIYNDKGLYDDYSTISTRILQERTAQQLEYGLTGHYNANLTARINQIADNNNQNVNVSASLSDLFPDEDEIIGEEDK